MCILYCIVYSLYQTHLQVYTNGDNKYDARDYDSAKFLDVTSTLDDDVNPDNYCLVYMFTHRDFSNGVLGTCVPLMIRGEKLF